MLKKILFATVLAAGFTASFTMGNVTAEGKVEPSGASSIKLVGSASAEAAATSERGLKCWPCVYPCLCEPEPGSLQAP